MQVKRDKLLRPAGTELTAYGFGVLLDFWVSEIRDALKKEGILSETSAAAGKVSEQDDSDQGTAFSFEILSPLAWLVGTCIMLLFR